MCVCVCVCGSGSGCGCGCVFNVLCACVSNRTERGKGEAWKMKVHGRGGMCPASRVWCGGGWAADVWWAVGSGWWEKHLPPLPWN